MRLLSPSVQQIVDSGNIKYFYLIELNFNLNYYLTSYSSDIPFNGKTYMAESGLFSIDSPRLSTVIDREAYKIMILDFNDQLGAEFRANVIGKPINVKLGLVDISNNRPLLDTSDIVEVYTGFVDTPSIEVDWENKVASLEGTSPMSDLDSVKPFITSKSGMDQISSSDTSFDLIFENSEAEIKWGKI